MARLPELAFSSPQTGPLGRVTEGHPTIWSRIPRNPPLDPPSLEKRVHIIPSSAGDDGTLARAALETEPDGIVLGTLGVSPAGLVAVAGAVGLAFSLAIQDILKNFFSGPAASYSATVHVSTSPRPRRSRLPVEA